MCNPKSSGKYYRCDCDTSEKRQLRRVNRKERDSAVNPLTPLGEQESSALPNPLPVEYQPTGDPRTDIQELQRLHDEHNGSLSGMSLISREAKAGTPPEELHRIREQHEKDTHTSMLITKEIGRNTSLLAEEKAGFTHEDMEKDYLDHVEVGKTIKSLEEKYVAARKEVPEDKEKVERLEAQLEEQREIKNNNYREFSKKNDRMAEAYQEAIREARGENMGAREIGITVSPHKAGFKKIAKKMESRLDCYPESWIAVSNSYDDLAPRESKRRSHYAQNTEVVTSRRIIPTIFSKSDPPKPNEEHQYRKLSEAEVEEHVEHMNRSIAEDYYEEVGWTHYSEFSHGKLDENGRPPGPRWEYKTIKQRDYSQEGEAYEEKTLWMRKKPKKRSAQNIQSSVRLSELTMPPSSLAGEGRTRSVLIHEFAHRMEDKMPRLGELQKAYLDSRKQGDETVRIFEEGKKEEAYEAGFQHLYTGKIYNDGGRHFEILSTGMEGLFGNEVGQFRSEKQPHMDTDFRDFVLGTVTSVKAGEA